MLFWNAQEKREVIYIGKVSQTNAEIVKGHVAHLVESKKTGGILPSATAKWLNERDDKLHAKLAAVGLVEPRRGAARAVELDGELRRRLTYLGVIDGDATPAQIGSLADRLNYFVAVLIEMRAGIEDSTKEILHRSRKNLIAFFGEARKLASVTKGDAIDFWDFLIRARKSGGAGLLESTARKRYVHATSFFKHALRKQLITENPFDDNGIVKTNMSAEEYFFLPPADAEKIIAKLPSGKNGAELRAATNAAAKQLKLIFACSRWQGMRVGSEPRALRWKDIDWTAGTMIVHAPKTKRHKGKDKRLCPMFPEFLAILQDRHAEAVAEGRANPDDLVIPWLRGRKDSAIREYIERAAAAAGVAMWPRMWQNLRATRQTELEDAGVPSHVVCKILGNSEKVAKKHYLRTHDHHYAELAGWKTPTGAPQVAPHSLASGAHSIAPAHTDPRKHGETLHSSKVKTVTEGFEPPVRLRARRFSRPVH